MNKRSTRITVSLLKLVKRLEIQQQQLKQCGVTILPLEHAQIDAINILLQVNGVHKNDDSVAWLCEPIFDFIENEITRAECIRRLYERFRNLRRKRLERREDS